MRHFRLPLAVAPLALGVFVAPAQTGLVALAGLSHTLLARLGRTPELAVALPSVALAANEYRGAAARAHEASSRRFLHRQIGPTGVGLDKAKRLVKYSRWQRRPPGLGVRYRL